MKNIKIIMLVLFIAALSFILIKDFNIIDENNDLKRHVIELTNKIIDMENELKNEHTINVKLMRTASRCELYQLTKNFSCECD